MKKGIVKQIIYRGLKVINPLLSNTIYSRLLFWYNCKRLNKQFYKLKLSNPATFNEKISYIKFNNRNHLAPLVADKYAVREYIKDKIGEGYLVPLIAKVESIDEVDKLLINTDCILKMNNGSGANLIVTKDRNLTLEEIKLFFKKAFSKDVYILSRE